MIEAGGGGLVPNELIYALVIFSFMHSLLLNFKIDFFFFYEFEKIGGQEITSTKSLIFLFSFIYLARGLLIEILICFQRSNCSSFTSHGLGKHPGLEQFNRKREYAH